MQKRIEFSKPRVASTSVEALDSVAPKMSDRAKQVLDFVRRRGQRGATNDEVALEFDWPPHSVPSITLRLLDAGLVIRNGDKRATRLGKNALVIRAKLAEANKCS